MNLGGKQDLDALLRSWPALPPKGVAAGAEEDRGWEERADAIVRAATAAGRAANDAAEALDAAPVLAAEPGEPAGEKTGAGEKKMSQENDPAEPPVSAGSAATPPASVAPPQTERKRTSLKEIAARASQSGARPSQSGAAPMSVRPSQAGVGPTSVRPPASVPMSRPSEAGKDDSGVVNLSAVQKSATPEEVAAAEKAKPGEAPLLEKAPAAAASAPKGAGPQAVPATNVVPMQPKRSNTGAIGGIAIAIIGLAAAAAIVMRKPAPPPQPVAQLDTPSPGVTAVVTAAPSQAPAPSAAPSASADPEGKVAQAPNGTEAASASGAPSAGATVAPSGVAVAAKGGGAPGKPGDLNSAMEKAVGKDGATAKADQAVTIEAKPAGGGSQNIPEQPSQGAVSAALRPVMAAAKACVAGADDVSRASVTFSSSGSVASVSVSGWAAAHGKSSCVQAALKGAKTSPFSKSSFVVGVPIRP